MLNIEYRLYVKFCHLEKNKNMFNSKSSWTTICSAFTNSADPDQLASEEANRSGSALFIIKLHVNLYKQPGSSNLIGWKFKEGGLS